ncbi:UNVERIFIED_CONTAM: hypothetical protein FKN15_010361 [Acipenser sinensis]
MHSTMGRKLQQAIKRVFDVLLKVIMRAMWFAGGFHWMTVKGRQALPTEAPILTLAPHSSYFDAIPVTMTMASIVMKAESKDIPVWGKERVTTIRQLAGHFNVRARLTDHSFQQFLGHMAAADFLCLPEITVDHGIKAQFFTKALIKYIRPVFVSRSDQDSRKKTVEEIKRRAHSEGKWPQFLPVYTPSDEEKKNPALFANNVRCLMAKALEVPVTDYSFEDCQLAMAEGQLKLPAETCLLEFAKLVRRLSLKPEKVEKDLEEYSERARKIKGKRLDLEGFASYLNLTVSDTLKDMFALFDELVQTSSDRRSAAAILLQRYSPDILVLSFLLLSLYECNEQSQSTGYRCTS